MSVRVVGAILVVAALAGCGGSDGTTTPGESAGWSAPQALGTAEHFGSLAGDVYPQRARPSRCGPGDPSALWANRLDPNLGWVSPETLWSAGARDVTAPALGVAPTGFALAAWGEARDSGARLWWTTFDPRRGWAVAQLVGLAGDARLVYGVRIAVNASGEGVLVWTQDDTVFASHYTTVEGPGAPEAIGRGGCQGLAVDSAGTTLALLIQPLVPLSGLMLRVYHPGRGWAATPALVTDDGTGSGALSLDARGNAWVVWANASGVLARRYVSGQGLQTAQPIATGRFGLLPQVVAEDGGGAIATWLDRNPNAATATILAARYLIP